MTGQDEQAFLHDCGVRLSQLLAMEPPPAGEDLSRRARSLVRDLLGHRQSYANPIGDVLDQLISETPTPGVAEARLAAISQQLQLTYNAQMTQLVISFARGFLQLGLDTPAVATGFAPPALRPEPSTAPAPGSLRPPGAMPPAQASPSGSPLGLVLFNQWLMLLTVLAGLGGIAVVVMHGLNRPAAVMPAGGESGGTAGLPSPARPRQEPAGSPAAPAPSAAPAGTGLYDAGVAVGGQRVLLDTASVASTSNPGRLRFRYWLGQEVVESEADCNRQTWTTFPEGQTHSPQSAATARMLSRVCQSAASAVPAPASGGDVATVFDPPSNIRATPNGAVLCSIRTRSSISILGREGDWYRTDACGTPGYIHRGQISF